MLCEIFTLTLRHELVNLDTKEKYNLEAPLSACYSTCDQMERGNAIYCVNELLHKLENAFLERMDSDT